jgi:threonyl-tRNA synthetase
MEYLRGMSPNLHHRRMTDLHQVSVHSLLPELPVWKNDKENKMLTRINGVAFHNQEELDAWEKEQQEARERDHRKIGKEMRLFMTDDLVGRGLPMFLPNGYTVWQQLEDYIKGKERERGYLHVMTPCIGTVNLYKTSGHWDHYRENMFPAMEMDGESYVLRPMNCPHHMMIYANQPHSYRDLPMRIGEIAHDFRYESSGTLKGIERGRHFCQNDAHLFCTPEQIKSEVADVCNLIFETYKDFNITDYRCVLSLRDPAEQRQSPLQSRKQTAHLHTPSAHWISQPRLRGPATPQRSGRASDPCACRAARRGGS